MRPAIERYVRSVVETNGIELVLGVQYENPVDYFGLLSVSKMLLRDAVDSLSGSHAVTNPALLADAVEREVVKQWPERYWFLEVCSASERDGWTQIFQPAPRPDIAALASQRCAGCLAEAQHRAKADDRLEQRIAALESHGGVAQIQEQRLDGPGRDAGDTVQSPPPIEGEAA